MCRDLTAPTYGASYGEGKVQGVVKAAQTGILWSQVQVLVGPPIVRKATDFWSVAFFNYTYLNSSARIFLTQVLIVRDPTLKCLAAELMLGNIPSGVLTAFSLCP